MGKKVRFPKQRLVGRHPIQSLSPVLIRHLNEPGYYCDGNGLYLQVSESGSKSWIVRTTINGKRREIGVGSFLYTTLADARDKAVEIRKSARNGGDPLTEKREAKKAAQRERLMPTFEVAARDVHREREKTFRNDLHKKHWIESLEKFAFPIIGASRVDQIESADVLRVLTPIWLRIPETARRVKQRMKTVLQWAKAAGHRNGDNPVEGIEGVLPKHNGADKHYPAMPYADVPAFIQMLRRDEGVSGRLAFEFLILTASRTIEVRLATWKEIDIEKKTWTRPAEHMKAGRAHKVPLSARCIEILDAAKKMTDGSPYIFPGLKQGKPLSNMVFHAALKRMEKTDITPHGFRSSFRDWAEEKTSHSRHAIETALAHVVKDKVEAAYLRTELFEKRAELMSAWERFCTPQPSEKVVSIKR